MSRWLTGKLVRACGAQCLPPELGGQQGSLPPYHYPDPSPPYQGGAVVVGEDDDEVLD